MLAAAKKAMVPPFECSTFADPAGSFTTAATFSKGVVIPELIYVAFQATFAAITVCLIVGAFAERIKFSAVLLFAVIWFTFSYLPIAHMVWFWMGPDAYASAEVVDAMNAKAAMLGMTDTHYVEPTGLSSKNQSSAKDLATLTDTNPALLLAGERPRPVGPYDGSASWRVKARLPRRR